MKKLMMLLIIGLFLIGIASAGITTSAIDNKNKSSNQIGAINNKPANAKIQDAEIQKNIGANLKNKLTDKQIREIFTYRNRIKKQYANQSECPEKCTCTGSTIKCELRNGTREMTVTAGQSGNVIIQVKGINASTNVELYRANDGKLYGVFKGNETRTIRVLPDQVSEKIREKIKARLENQTIELDKDGIYRIKAKKRAKLFAIFPIRVIIQAEMNSETGEILKIRRPWWNFLLRDEKEETLGTSCVTVSPESRDKCCQNKSYDFWNEETEECEFNAE